MQNTHVIIWVAKGRDRSGIGQKHFNQDEAEALARQLNDSHPEFLHRAIDPRVTDTTSALQELRASLSASHELAMPVPEFAALQASTAEVATIIDPATPPAMAARMDDFVPLHPMLFA